MKPTLVNGVWWYPFQVYHLDPDGRKYSFTIFAISKDHAACIVDDIKETAWLGDQIDRTM